MKWKLIQIITLLIIGVFIISCQKKEDEDQATVSAIPVPTTPNIKAANGHFLAQREFKSSPPYPNKEEGSVGVYFYNMIGLDNAGDVFCNGMKLFTLPYPGGGVIYGGDSNLNLKGNVTWHVSGSASVQPFSHTVTTGFPYISEIKGPDTLTKGMDYTINIDTLTPADSVVFEMHNLKFTAPGNVKSHTFSKNDFDFTNDFPGSFYPTFITIYAYTHSAILVNGKNYYFKNSSLRTRNITR